MDATPQRRPCTSAEESRRGELERALRRLRCGEKPAQVLEALSRRLTNKLLHAPTKAIAE